MKNKNPAVTASASNNSHLLDYSVMDEQNMNNSRELIQTGFKLIFYFATITFDFSSRNYCLSEEVLRQSYYFMIFETHLVNLKNLQAVSLFCLKTYEFIFRIASYKRNPVVIACSFRPALVLENPKEC